ncbi:MAG: hypothetical protein EXS03_01640 [Phycisphaerales bacterium]|nr:hypothetical protein [Phycisphaerales bacterium]
MRTIGSLILAGTLCGCAASSAKIDPARAIAQAPHPSALSIFDGATGSPLDWRQVLDQVAHADAVFVGETHDDATAHALEHALVDAFLASHPSAAVSIEFLERDDQAATDQYLRGESELDAFIEATKSRHWAGTDTWIPWYQPMIDSAKRSKARVIAANAPRRYVSKARTEGYEALTALPPDERALFEVDESISRDGDWERLKALVIEMRADGSGHGDSPSDSPIDEEIDQFHRAQRVWDRTMGLSAARAYAGGARIIHVEGAFHIGTRLGTVAQFAAATPGAKILVIDLVPSNLRTRAPATGPSADIVVHTKLPAP